MTDRELLVIVPTYEHFDYAAIAVASALESSGPGTCVLAVDDASPSYDQRSLLPLVEKYPGRVIVSRFDRNGGLTRSWNSGLRVARDMGFVYACCANADLVFGRGWDVPIKTALAYGHLHLAGPVTNAPGTEKKQDVRKYFSDYRLRDGREHVDAAADYCRSAWGDEEWVAGTLNGFCMAAKTATWWANPFDAVHVFRPRNDFDSKGRPNPTPLMTLNEYELQARWHKAGLRTGFCPGSFVFHYRSVSRGDRFRSAGWFRKDPATNPLL